MMKTEITVILYFLLYSGVHSIFAQDKTPPERPYITYVTVDTSTNFVDVYWTLSPSSDVMEYNIYYEILTINGYEGVKLGSVTADSVHYRDSTGIAGMKKLMYSVTAVDSSGNESLRLPGLHSTVHTTTFYDSCNNAMIVTWNKYTGWENNVSGYRLYGREENESFRILTGVTEADSFFIMTKIKENTHYYYYVEAVKNDGLISRSNIARKYTYAPDPPGSMVIDYASVTGNNLVEIKFEFAEGSEIGDFALLRSSDKNSDFISIKKMMNIGSSPLIITDSIYAGHESFYYRIGALNSCSFVIDTSNLACNILLKGRNANYVNILSWNHYRNFPSGIQSYEIYRQDTEGVFNLILTNNPYDTTFEDNIGSLYGQGYYGKIAYKVHAVENSTGNYSASNICEIEMKTEIMVPDAFTPNGDGKNDYFRPVMSFIPAKFLMIIYNRYGISVYKSTDPQEGWDGRINENSPAPEGVYTYHIEYTSVNGQKKVVKPGTVTLFYPR